MPHTQGQLAPPFNTQAFLESSGLGEQSVTYAKDDVIFTQGDPSESVVYVRSGGIQLSVLSHAGKEAIVATLRAGDFLGERALAGHPIRLETARATMASAVLVVPKQQMIRLLHSQHAFERIVALVEEKRKLVPDAKRVDYQRELMRDRRARLAKALELHQLKTGKLPMSQRELVEKQIAVRWAKARDELVSAKGNVSWADRNAAAQEFWEGIDRQLDAKSYQPPPRRTRYEPVFGPGWSWPPGNLSP